MTRVKLHVTKHGSIQVVDVEGAGANCRALTEQLEKRLGVVDEASRRDTESLYHGQQQGEQSISM